LVWLGFVYIDRIGKENTCDGIEFLSSANFS
jgi:hypothetical protein